VQQRGSPRTSLLLFHHPPPPTTELLKVGKRREERKGVKKREKCPVANTHTSGEHHPLFFYRPPHLSTCFNAHAGPDAPALRRKERREEKRTTRFFTGVLSKLPTLCLLRRGCRGRKKKKKKRKRKVKKRGKAPWKKKLG